MISLAFTRPYPKGFSKKPSTSRQILSKSAIIQSRLFGIAGNLYFLAETRYGKNKKTPTSTLLWGPMMAPRFASSSASFSFINCQRSSPSATMVYTGTTGCLFSAAYPALHWKIKQENEKHLPKIWPKNHYWNKPHPNSFFWHHIKSCLKKILAIPQTQRQSPICARPFQPSAMHKKTVTIQHRTARLTTLLPRRSLPQSLTSIRGSSA